MSEEIKQFLSHLSTETLLLVMMSIQSDIDWGYYAEDYGDINVAQEYIDWIVAEWEQRDKS